MISVSFTVNERVVLLFGSFCFLLQHGARTGNDVMSDATLDNLWITVINAKVCQQDTCHIFDRNKI